nr:hypothetical protein [Lysobacter terrigena]
MQHRGETPVVDDDQRLRGRERQSNVLAEAHAVGRDVVDRPERDRRILRAVGRAVHGVTADQADELHVAGARIDALQHAAQRGTAAVEVARFRQRPERRTDLVAGLVAPAQHIARVQRRPTGQVDARLLARHQQ